MKRQKTYGIWKNFRRIKLDDYTIETFTPKGKRGSQTIKKITKTNKINK